MPDETVKVVKTELDLDIAPFSKSTEQATRSAEELETEIEDLKKRLEELGTTSQREGKKVENVLNTLIPKFLGFRAVVSVIRSSWTNIITMDQSVTALNYTLGQSAKEIENFAKSYSRNATISENAILELSASFSTLLQNIVGGNDLIAATTINLVAQIDRISSATGRSVDDIERRFQSLIRGNLSAFRDLGIDTRKEYLQLTDTFKELANGRQWDDLTRNERTQIALIETMRQVDERFGEDVDSLSNRLGTLSSRWEDLTTSIGGLLYVATPVIEFFTQIIQTATDGIDALNELGDGFAYVVIGGAVFVAFAPAIVKGLIAIFTGSIKASTGFLLLGASILWFALIAASVFRKSEEDVTDVIEDQTDAIEDEIEATEELDDARKGLMGIDEINTLRGSSGSSLLGDDDFTGDFNDNWIQDYLDGLGDLQNSIGDTISELDSLGNTFNTIMTIIAAASGILGIFTIATKLVTWETQRQTKAKLAAAQAELAKTTATTKAAAATASETTTTAANTTAETVNTAATKKATIATWLQNASLATKIGLLTLGIGAVAIVGAAIALGIQMNSNAQSVEAHLAHGGVATGSVIAEIGEGRYNEAVIPLGDSPEFNDMKEDIAQRVLDNDGSGGTIHTVIQLNGRDIVEATSENMHDDWKRKGWI